jgi:hypothetical protein
LQVFLVEEWEKQLVMAGRVAKVNLMAEAKRSTNRDFRIKLPGLPTQQAG